MHCSVGTTTRGGEKRRVQLEGIDLVGHQRRQGLRWRTSVLEERARRREESIVGGEGTESEDEVKGREVKLGVRAQRRGLASCISFVSRFDPLGSSLWVQFTRDCSLLPSTCIQRYLLPSTLQNPAHSFGGSNSYAMEALLASPSPTESSKTFLSSLPPELLAESAGHLPSGSLARFSLVSCFVRDAVESTLYRKFQLRCDGPAEQREASRWTARRTLIMLAEDPKRCEMLRELSFRYYGWMDKADVGDLDTLLRCAQILRALRLVRLARFLETRLRLIEPLATTRRPLKMTPASTYNPSNESRRPSSTFLTSRNWCAGLARSLFLFAETRPCATFNWSS